MPVFRFLVAACLVAATALHAADAPAIVKTIAKVNISPTERGQSVPEALVRANILSREGEEFTLTKLNNDVKRLMATAQFDYVEGTPETGADGNVTINFRVTPKPNVEKIEFQGNETYKTKKLMKQLEMKTGAILDARLLAADKATLIDYYQRKGFNGVIVKQDVERLENTRQVNVVYTITESTRYKTRGINFVGNSAFKEGELKRVMGTSVSLLGRILPMFGWFNETEFQDDLIKIARQYRDAGYLDFRVGQVERVYKGGDSNIHLTINLSEGEAYNVTSVDFADNAHFSEAYLRDQIKMVAGERYRGDVQDRDVKVFTALYNQDGYLESRVIPQLVPTETPNTVKLTYRVIEGKSFTIGDINIKGNTVTKDEVIRRELLLKPGDKADITRIDGSSRRLMGLGYFADANIIPNSPIISKDLTEEEKKRKEQEKDLTVTVAEKQTGRLMLSAGFSSTDSIVGGLEVAQSNFDITDPWGFRGDGQRFRARAFVGSERNDLILSWTEPWLFDKRLRFDTDFWSRTTSSNRDYDQTAQGGSFRFTKKLEAPFWKVSTGLRLESMQIDDMDVTDFSAPLIAFEEDDSIVSAINLTFTRDSRDRRINPNSGSVFTFKNELQSQAFGSYTDAYTLTLGYDYYLPIFKKTVVKFSSEMSSIQDFGGGDDIRIFDRLFAGGAKSIRGFDERDISPTEPGFETPIGGQSSWVSSVEVLTPLYQDIVYWAVFTDFGNVWSGAFDFNPGEFNVGVGVGLRLRLPIGAVNIDYGFPVVRDQDHLDSGGQPHFNMGYNF